MAEYKLPYSGAEIARRLEQAGKVDAIETKISQILKIYPILGLFDTDPSTWGDPLATQRRDPWYSLFMNRAASKYQIMKYSQETSAWEYVKDVEAGEMMLMLNDSNEGAIKKHRKYDIWQFVKAYDSNGNLQGMTVRTILNFPYDIVALREDIPTDEHINGLINSALGVVENGSY